MSSAGVTVAPPQSYFCYQCNRTVTLTPLPNSDLSCPHCHGGFLEEFESNPNPNPNPFSSSPVFPDPFSLFSYATVDLENPRNFPPFLSPSPSSAPAAVAAFNPFDFLQEYLQNLRNSGANVQFVVGNHPVDPNSRLPSNLGDYFLGPGLEQLIQQLAENDPNRHGPPPASKRAVDELPTVSITKENVGSDSNWCAVCMNEYEVGSEVKQMPCKHLYHFDCLIPWLQLHNSCPVCRYELPTDDPDYDSQRGSSGQGSSTGGGRLSGSGSGNERRFRISLPWPFSAFGGNADNNSDNGDGNNSNSGSHGSEPRDESLD